MPKLTSLSGFKNSVLSDIQRTETRYNLAWVKFENNNHLLLRWIAAMSAVEANAIWERYAEMRLAIALNHHPEHFIKANDIKGQDKLSIGLCVVLVRGGDKYFDFRSTNELVQKAKRLVANEHNPFVSLKGDKEKYLDALATIRNKIVHNSEAASRAYKRKINEVYSIRSAPEPDEFLNAKDKRPTSLLRDKPRLSWLIETVKQSVSST